MGAPGTTESNEVCVYHVVRGQAIHFGEDIPSFDDLRGLAMSHQLQEGRVREICRQIGVPPQIRGLVWQHLLGVRQLGLDALSSWDFDMRLPNAASVYADCQATCQNREISANSKSSETRSVVDDMNFVVTLVCKTKSRQFEHGLTDVASIFFSLGLSRTVIFNSLSSAVEKYAKGFYSQNPLPRQRLFKLLRLLLMYHDPTLCKHLDDLNITPDVYANTWFATIFSWESQSEAVMTLWDCIFTENDESIILFFALAAIMLQRDHMLEQPAQTCLDRLCLFCLNSSFEVLQLWHAALRYRDATPRSFVDHFHQAMDAEETASAVESKAEGAIPVITEPWACPCLPVTSLELADSQLSHRESGVRNKHQFFVLDCRPSDLFSRGHLPRSIHCGYDVLRGSGDISEFLAKLQPMKGKYHMCLLTAGDGSNTHWVSKLSLALRAAAYPYVCFAQEGYLGLKKLLPPGIEVVDNDEEWEWAAPTEPVVEHSPVENTPEFQRDKSVENDGKSGDAVPAVANTKEKEAPSTEEHDDADDLAGEAPAAPPPAISDLDSYLEALSLFKELADNGDTDKQLALGRMYFLAHGVPQSLTHALQYYTHASERGDSEAHNSLGFMYSKGMGIPQDVAKGVEHYLRAAEAKNADAAANLGFLYSSGKGVPLNLTKSFYWYEKAAELGNSRAQHNLAIFYETGRAVEIDLTMALYWYRKSAEQGNAKAINVLGVIYWKGRGVPKDSIMAYMFFALGAKLGSPLSIRNADVIKSKMSVEDISRSEKLACEWEKRYVKKKASLTTVTHPFHAFRVTMHA